MKSKNLFIYKDKTACLTNAGSRIILGIKYKKGEGVYSNIAGAFLSQTFHSNSSSAVLWDHPSGCSEVGDPGGVSL